MDIKIGFEISQRGKLDVAWYFVWRVVVWKEKKSSDVELTEQGYLKYRLGVITLNIFEITTHCYCSMNYWRNWWQNVSCYTKNHFSLNSVRNNSNSATVPVQKSSRLLIVVYFFQVLRAPESIKRFKMNEKDKNDPQKVFQPAFGSTQHPKAGQHTQPSINHLRKILGFMPYFRFLAQLLLSLSMVAIQILAIVEDTLVPKAIE